MQNSREARALMVGQYIVSNNATVRSAGKKLGISKSTVHNDVHNILKYIDNALYLDAVKVLEYNRSVRHIRGGEATKRLYVMKKVAKL